LPFQFLSLMVCSFPCRGLSHPLLIFFLSFFLRLL
jgi:hypothetical protein